MTNLRKTRILKLAEEKRDKYRALKVMGAAAAGSGLGAGAALLAKRKMDRVGTPNWFSKLSPLGKKRARMAGKAGLALMPLAGLGAGLLARKTDKKIKEELKK